MAQLTQDLIDKQLRSVFVGNIPYETDEEELKNIFSRAGPVLSFRIVVDRDTNKPKGYGFCEYRDVETAQSAIRNLNGLGLHNRVLRVDSAVLEKGRDEIKEPKGNEIPVHGPMIAHEIAPKVIIDLLGSLPPEQITEFLVQMKHSLTENPQETRELLISNPQLTFALLQALLLTKTVDPKVVHEMIIRQTKINPNPSPRDIKPIHDSRLPVNPPNRYDTPHRSKDLPPHDAIRNQHAYEPNQEYMIRKTFRNEQTTDRYMAENERDARRHHFMESPYDRSDVGENRASNYQSNIMNSEHKYDDRHRNHPKYPSHDTHLYENDPKTSYKRYNDPRVDYLPEPAAPIRDREARPYDGKETKNVGKSSVKPSVDPRIYHTKFMPYPQDEYSHDRRDYPPNSECPPPYPNEYSRHRQSRYR